MACLDQNGPNWIEIDWNRLKCYTEVAQYITAL